MLGEGLVVFSSFARRRPIRLAANFYTRTTLAAWKPFGPLVRSNSTVSPSFKLRYPFSWIAEKCTNTSSPVERWINPYPFAPLNHFTVPFSLTEKTPFTNREELFFQILGLRSIERGPPQRSWSNFAVASTMCTGNYFQKEKAPRFCMRCHRSENLWSPAIWRVIHHTQQTSTRVSGHSTGQLNRY